MKTTHHTTQKGRGMMRTLPGILAGALTLAAGAAHADSRHELVRLGNEAQPTGALTGASVFVSPGHGWVWDPQRGWRTQRGVSHGLIEDHSNGEAVLQYFVPYLWNAGATVYTTRERCMNTNMVIVEPGGDGLELEGDWSSERLPGTWNGMLYSHTTTDGPATARAIYTPDIPEDGHYAVYLWYRPARTGSTAEDARVFIRHSGGDTLWTQNQNHGGYTWKYVGTYHFEAGADSERGAVVIENTSSDPDSQVVAGAVRFGGGMSDTMREGTTTGRPRWEESGRYYAKFAGFQPEKDTRVYNTVSAMPMFSEWLAEPHEVGRSIYLSWHTNASGGAATARGLFTFIYQPDRWGGVDQFTGYPGGVELAFATHNAVMAAVHADYDPEWHDGPVVTRYLGETNPRNNNRMPAALLEYGFHDNVEDAAYILDPIFRDTVSKGTYAGVVEYFVNEVPGFDNATLLPEKPTGLSVSYLGGGRAEISWEEPPYNDGTRAHLGDRATSYRIYKSPNGYGFCNGYDVPDRTAILTGLEPGELAYFRVTARNKGGESFPSETLALRVPEESGGQRVLLVNGFHRLDRAMNFHDGRSYRGILSRMNTYNYSVQHAAAADRPGLLLDGASSKAVRAGRVNLAGYDAVIWIMGRETAGSFSLDRDLRDRMDGYLAMGGSLMISGTDIGTALTDERGGEAFLRRVFRAELASGDSGSHTAMPANETDIPELREIRFDDGSGPVYHADRPDVFRPAEGGHALLSYANGNGDEAAAIVYAEDYRLLLMGFPFETIEDPEVRRTAMQGALEFLLDGRDATPAK